MPGSTSAEEDRLRVRLTRLPEVVCPRTTRWDFSSLDALNDVWANWSSDMAKRFVIIGYTICPNEPETIEATDEYIKRNSPPAALHRLLVEGRDDVARALRCRERDALSN